jgi:hypothetical protein
MAKIQNTETFNCLKGMLCKEQLNACKQYRENPDGPTKPTLILHAIQ